MNEFERMFLSTKKAVAMPELKDVRIPLYQQLMEELKAIISTGLYTAGQKIPSESELSTAYNVSRITVRRAIEELCHEGYLTKFQGKGTFVNENRATHKIVHDQTLSFTETCRNNHITADAHVLGLERVDARGEDRKFFGLEEGEQLFHLTRLRTADGTPVLIENTYFPCKHHEAITPEDVEHVSLIEKIEQTSGRRIARKPAASIEVIKARAEQASLLDVLTGDPLFYVQTYLTDISGKPLAVGYHYIVGRRFMFKLQAGQNASDDEGEPASN